MDFLPISQSSAPEAILQQTTEILDRPQGGIYSSTLSAAQRSEGDTLVANEAPVLPPKTTNKTDYLETLTSSYINLFNASGQTVETEVNCTSTFQGMDQAMSQAVINLTNISVAKEKTLLQEQTEINNIQEQSQQVEDTWGKAIEWIGIVVCAGVVLASLGPTAASLLGITSSAIDGAAAGGAAAEAAGDAAVGAGADAAADGAADGIGEALDEAAAPQGNVAAQNPQAAADASGSAKETAKDWGKVFYKLLMKLGVGSIMVSPQIYQGVAQLQMGKYYSETAAVQRSLEAPMAHIQEVTQYEKYYQTLIQRKTNLATTLAQGCGNVIQMAGNAMSTVRQISYGLSQAV